MNQSLKNSCEIAKRGGAVAASDWTSGGGRHVSKRTIPPYCIEIKIMPSFENIGSDGNLKTFPAYLEWDKSKLEKLPAYAKRAIEKLQKERPKVQKVIALVDRRGLKKALREIGKPAEPKAKDCENVIDEISKLLKSGFKQLHTSTYRGYVSRKGDGYLEPYKGRFGQGFVHCQPYWQSTGYSLKTYYIKESA